MRWRRQQWQQPVGSDTLLMPLPLQVGQCEKKNGVAAPKRRLWPVFPLSGHSCARIQRTRPVNSPNTTCSMPVLLVLVLRWPSLPAKRSRGRCWLRQPLPAGGGTADFPFCDVHLRRQMPARVQALAQVRAPLAGPAIHYGVVVTCAQQPLPGYSTSRPAPGDRGRRHACELAVALRSCEVAAGLLRQ